MSAPTLPVADVSHSLCPFWFWNDTLDADEILRQMADFRAHGVGQFVLHPRVGLPSDCGWMSEKLLGFMRVALVEAAATGMKVVLYDEGMYPSGSSSGQVVARDAAHSCRGLVPVCLAASESPAAALSRLDPQWDAHFEGISRTGDGTVFAIVSRRLGSTIRGLHYHEEPSAESEHRDEFEETPPAADILNPAAVRSFIDLVHERYHREFGAYFGSTIVGIFTDEPSLLGRMQNSDSNILPGTAGILGELTRLTGRDWRDELAVIWDARAAKADRAYARRAYLRAVARRLDETFYAPLRSWCDAHGIALWGHPHEPDDCSHLRHFTVPGQDLVWRWVEPGKLTGLTGRESTSAKAAASLCAHLRLARNLNEYAGAFGPELTFAELRGLTGWLLVRGCNLLVPHAFYYSVRGPRRTERAPDVGAHSSWWPDFAPYAYACQRLCALNTAATPVVSIAIWGEDGNLPWAAARLCFEARMDFHYVTADELPLSQVEPDGLRIADHVYACMIHDLSTGLDAPATTIAPERIIRWHPDQGDAALLAGLVRFVAPLALDCPSPNLRVRRLRWSDDASTSPIHEACFLFNEGLAPLRVGGLASERLTYRWFPERDITIALAEGADAEITLNSFEWAVLLREA